MKPLVAGIFVGGASSRMGGRPKGLLRTDEGMTLVERWREVLAPLGAEVVLVGRNRAYASLGLPLVEDDPDFPGPLGGLLRLLAYGDEGRVLAVACDMPFVSTKLLQRLLDTSPDSAIVAPRVDGRWQPFFARYQGDGVLGRIVMEANKYRRSLQLLLDDEGATELVLSPEEAEELRDWDTPEDVRKKR